MATGIPSFQDRANAISGQKPYCRFCRMSQAAKNGILRTNCQDCKRRAKRLEQVRTWMKRKGLL